MNTFIKRQILKLIPLFIINKLSYEKKFELIEALDYDGIDFGLAVIYYAEAIVETFTTCDYDESRVRAISDSPGLPVELKTVLLTRIKELKFICLTHYVVNGKVSYNKESLEILIKLNNRVANNNCGATKVESRIKPNKVIKALDYKDTIQKFNKVMDSEEYKSMVQNYPANKVKLLGLYHAI